MFRPGQCSCWWLRRGLIALNEQLKCLGSSILFRRAKNHLSELLKIIEETGAEAVFFTHLYDTISLVRDGEVKLELQRRKIFSQSFIGDVLHEPWEIMSENKEPFWSFNEFWNEFCKLDRSAPLILPKPSKMPPLPDSIQLGSIDEMELLTNEELACLEHLSSTWIPGTEGAFIILDLFCHTQLTTFSLDKAKTNFHSTSRLSPHIHYGEISIKIIYNALGYREYSRYLSFHFPFTNNQGLCAHLNAIPWKYDHDVFKAWRHGLTGYPMVDAGMRQLWSTGWLHNRSRVICASFLVKNLLLPWQWGVKHYWDCLIDADLECDILGWQYCSGCLVDVKAFNFMVDVSDGDHLDPDGAFVRRWIPALARLPTKYIHKPWLAPPHILQQSNVELGVSYPYPIISLEDSCSELNKAWEIIKETMRSAQENLKLPYRPASKAIQSQSSFKNSGKKDGKEFVNESDSVASHSVASRASGTNHLSGQAV